MFQESVRRWNDGRLIIVIISNFSVHRSADVAKKVVDLDIHLVFLPSYSLDLNPIRYIRRKLKRVVFNTRTVDREHMTSLLEHHFLTEASKPSSPHIGKRYFYLELL